MVNTSRTVYFIWPSSFLQITPFEPSAPLENIDSLQQTQDVESIFV